MSNIVEFPKRFFTVKFRLPDDKIIKVHKSKDDNIDIRIEGTQGIATLRACSQVQAQYMVAKIFPDSFLYETN
jgi:hypothetical protein